MAFFNFFLGRNDEPRYISLSPDDGDSTNAKLTVSTLEGTGELRLKCLLQRRKLFAIVSFFLGVLFTIVIQQSILLIYHHQSSYARHSSAEEREFVPDCKISTIQVRKHNKTHVKPLVPAQAIEFQQDPRFANPPDAETNLAWDSLLPVGRGFVLIANPEAYSLRPGIPTDRGADRYSVAMFHQLHCLGLIRKEYYQFASPSSNTQPFTRHGSSGHFTHCIDYLRQSIMCAADMTIEPALVGEDGSRTGVDGWGITHHNCKNWHSVWDWMLEHHAENNKTHIA